MLDDELRLPLLTPHLHRPPRHVLRLSPAFPSLDRVASGHDQSLEAAQSEPFARGHQREGEDGKRSDGEGCLKRLEQSLQRRETHDGRLEVNSRFSVEVEVLEVDSAVEQEVETTSEGGLFVARDRKAFELGFQRAEVFQVSAQVTLILVLERLEEEVERRDLRKVARVKQSPAASAAGANRKSANVAEDVLLVDDEDNALKV